MSALPAEAISSPDVKLPASVRAQIERANAIGAKLKAGQPVTAADIGPHQEAVSNPVAAPAAPAPAAPAASAAPAAAASALVAPAAPAPAPTDSEWQHRYSVLQGKYNAEVPRLHDQLRTQSGRMQQMEAQLTSMQTLLGNLGQQHAAPPAPAPTRLVKPEEVKEFGQDLYDFIKRAAREEVLPEIGSMVDQRVGPVAQQVQQIIPAVGAVQERQAQSAQDRVYTELDRMCPGWEQTNEHDPVFGEWLRQPDPYAGVARGVMLAQAFQNGDAPRVAQFFLGYRKENAAVSPGAPVAPTAPTGATPAVDLAALAAPGTGIGGPPAGAPNEAGKRIYTVPEITAFYRDVQKGVYRTREADRVAIERDIFLAQKQNRIRPR